MGIRSEDTPGKASPGMILLHRHDGQNKHMTKARGDDPGADMNQIGPGQPLRRGFYRGKYGS